MAKGLRTKLANAALCGTMIINIAGQAVPVYAQSELNENNIGIAAENRSQNEEGAEETVSHVDVDKTDVEQDGDTDEVEKNEVVDIEDQQQDDQEEDTEEKEPLAEEADVAENLDATTGATTGNTDEAEEETGSVMVSDGEYIVDISAVGVSNGTAVHQLKADKLTLKVENGKAYLETFIEKGSAYSITSLEQKVDGAYIPVKTEEVTIEGKDYVRGQIALDYIDQKAYIKFGIKVGDWEHAPEAILSLTEASIEKLQKENLENEIIDEETGSIMIADGEHIVSIDAVGAGTGAAVHQLRTEKINLKVKNGKVYIETLVAKGLNYEVTSLEQKVNGKYVQVETEEVTIDGITYVRGWTQLNYIDQKAYIRFGIKVGAWEHAPEAILQLTEESIAALTATVGMNVVSENATDHDFGSIILDAFGGSGQYEYTIDGGQIWESSNIFTGLAAGSYKAAARDSENTEKVTHFKEVTISKEQTLAEGEYIVPITLISNSDEQNVQIVTSGLTLNVSEESMFVELLIASEGEGYVATSVSQKMNGKKEELQMEKVIMNDVEYLKVQVKLANTKDQAILVIGGTTRSAFEQQVVIKVGKEAEALKMQASQKSMTAFDGGMITLTGEGGSGHYQYTIDHGMTWHDGGVFTNLSAGTYQVAVRDAHNQIAITEYQKIIISEYTGNGTTGLKDGDYSVNIKVLQASSDTTSMAAIFFNKSRLPLEIRNGKAYLTIQVAKDGSLGGTYFRDVISSMSQKINGQYTSLDLENLHDSSKRYITTTVVFENIDEEAYLKCAIAPMGGEPILRIKLEQSSIQEGLGSLNTGLGAMKTSVESVTAENGKVTIKLSQADDEVKATDFTGKIYLDGATGKALTLNNFTMNDTTVTFTYDEVKQIEKDQKVIIGMTYKEIEVKAEAFIVLAEGKKPETAPIVSQITLKENAKEVDYINGYTDGTFKPNKEVSKAEALKMLLALVDIQERNYLTANMDVLQSDKDEASMAKQFFKTQGVKIEKVADGYMISLEIANEGLGFENIITGISQKIDGKYTALEVTKSADMKKAYVTIKTADLKEAILLQTGIAPMGNVAPELRLVFDAASVKESAFQSQYGDINGWAQDVISAFESAGVIGGDSSSSFGPNKAMTRGELMKIIALSAGLEMEENASNTFNDITDHPYENYILAAIKAGLIVGFGDGSFRPDKTLTRAEAVTILNRLAGHDGSTHVTIENPFRDLKTSHWAYNEIIKVTHISK